jgi:hypothetical protein
MLSSMLLLNAYFQCAPPMQQRPVIAQINAPTSDGPKSKIQVALLLDTSNSMDGLIDQAKAQLWKMVNKLSGAKKNDQNIELEIALFEYGNNGINAETGYIRLVQTLGSDLDGLSEKLFELRTNGGEEYCGWAIQSAQELLPWSTDPNHLKIIVIAGNEPFDQGKVNFRRSCASALQAGIVINTIHCGDYQTGVNTHWKEGATIGNGKYLNINTDQKVVHIATPYDDKIIILNERMNKTYLGYGSLGESKKERQVAQDRNAAEYGAANAVQRAAAKSKDSYSNSDWDVVDAAKNDKSFSSKVKQDELPAELRGKSAPELDKEIARLSTERDAIRSELAGLEKQMQAFVAEEMKKQSATQTLDNVLIEAVVEQAKGKGFLFE